MGVRHYLGLWHLTDSIVLYRRFVLEFFGRTYFSRQGQLGIGVD